MVQQRVKTLAHHHVNRMSSQRSGQGTQADLRRTGPVGCTFFDLTRRFVELLDLARFFAFL